MSDPIDKMLDAAESGKSIIKNREILHFTYMVYSYLIQIM